MRSSVKTNPSIKNNTILPDNYEVFRKETNPSIKNNTILPDNYEVFRTDRNHFCGGVLIAVKGLECFEVSELQEDCELIWVCIKLRGRKTLYICPYYRPDKSHETSLELFRVSLSKAATISNAQILIVGGLNLPSGDWKQMTLKHNPSYAQLHEDFINRLSDCGLVQLVEEPTREANTLDLIISNCLQLHEDFINRLSDCGLVQLVEEPTREANTLDLIISNCPQLHEDFINRLSDCGLVQLVEEPTREANTLDLIISNCLQLHEDFINRLSDCGLVQLVEEPTREANTLDLIISNCLQLFPSVEVLPGLSDCYQVSLIAARSL